MRRGDPAFQNLRMAELKRRRRSFDEDKHGIVRVWTLSEAVENFLECKSIESLCQNKVYYEYQPGQQILRFAASNVAKVTGLHDYAHIAEDFMDVSLVKLND